jgi:long-chain acyl-CoA synthetase
MKPATTLPRLLQANAARIPARPALREKRGGIWQVLSWSGYANLVSRFAAGLAEHGFAGGDRLVVIGDNRPPLYAAMLAAQSLGGAAVPLLPDAEPAWLARVLNHAGVSVVVAEDSELAERIISIRQHTPRLRLIVQTASPGVRQGGSDAVKPFEALCEDGRAAPERGEPGAPALLLYADDTQGAPNALVLSHADLCAAADVVIASEYLGHTDDVVAWLPMAWFADVMASQALALAAGCTCNFPEHPETVARDLREIGPTIMVAPPPIWERILADIETRAAHATPLKRSLFARFRRLAEHAAQLRAAGEPLSSVLRIRLGVGELLIHAPLRDQMGLRRLRWASTGGEPVAPRLLQGFRALGIDLQQSHGMPALASPVREPVHA